VKFDVPGVTTQIPLLTHGELEQGLIGVSHFWPVKAVGQIQARPLTSDNEITHVPPFKHVEPVHGLYCSQKVPE
jgi:hypothetical protein